MIPHETIFMDRFGELHIYSHSYVWGLHRRAILQSSICGECGKESFIDILEDELKTFENLGVL